YDANPHASPYDHSAARLLHSGQRAGAVPGIDPAAQRDPRGPKTVEDRSRVGALLCVHSFVGGMGRSSAIRKWQSRVVSHFNPFVERVRTVSPRGSKGSRQCLRGPPSSPISSRRYSTLRQFEPSAISHMMSLQGHDPSFGDVGSMSALAHFADSSRTSHEVREVPEADSCVAACETHRTHITK